jgi:hypothetical protein
VAKDWLKRVLSSDKRDFRNFVPPLDDDTRKLFVQFFWLLKANDGSKAKDLLREARRMRGMEPQRLYADSHGERLEPGGDTALSVPGISTATKQSKLPATLKRKQNVSKPTLSMITKHQGAARTNFKKKGQSIPKARTTAGGLNPAINKNVGSRIVSDEGE